MPSSLPEARLARQRRAAAVLFFLNGALLASWATEVPHIKAALGLSELQLGIVLLAFTGGSALILPFIGWSICRYGIRVIAGGATLSAAMGLMLSALATDMATLALSLVLFGAGFGALDVALNNAGVVLERDAKRPLMSGLHAMYSLGALVGAVLGGLLVRFGATPSEHFTLLLLMSCLVVLALVRSLPSNGGAASAVEEGAGLGGRTWSLPLVTLGILAACAAIPEGAVADWVGVYLAETVQSPKGAEALGFAGFSLMMLIGRLFGDRLSEIWGPVRVAQLGSALAAIGLALALGLPDVVTVIGGFALMGLGISVLAPLAFSAVGRVAPDNTSSAVAVVTAFFYLGYLAGPPVIGALAHLSSLRAALLVLLLAVFIAALLSPALRGSSRSGLSSRA
jgi:MFS family permease